MNLKVPVVPENVNCDYEGCSNIAKYRVHISATQDANSCEEHAIELPKHYKLDKVD